MMEEPLAFASTTDEDDDDAADESGRRSLFHFQGSDELEPVTMLLGTTAPAPADTTIDPRRAEKHPFHVAAELLQREAKAAAAAAGRPPRHQVIDSRMWAAARANEDSLQGRLHQQRLEQLDRFSTEALGHAVTKDKDTKVDHVHRYTRLGEAWEAHLTAVSKLSTEGDEGSQFSAWFDVYATLRPALQAATPTPAMVTELLHRDSDMRHTIITGNAGSGKTHVARLIRELIELVWKTCSLQGLRAKWGRLGPCPTSAPWGRAAANCHGSTDAFQYRLGFRPHAGPRTDSEIQRLVNDMGSAPARMVDEAQTRRAHEWLLILDTEARMQQYQQQQRELARLNPSLAAQESTAPAPATGALASGSAPPSKAKRHTKDKDVTLGECHSMPPLC